MTGTLVPVALVRSKIEQHFKFVVFKFGTLLLLCLALSVVAQAAFAQDSLRARLKRRQAVGNRDEFGKSQRYQIAGLDVAVWLPPHTPAPSPLVVFSHGFHGRNTQSEFIMQSLAEAGYLVIAPNRKDASKIGKALHQRQCKRMW